MPVDLTRRVNIFDLLFLGVMGGTFGLSILTWSTEPGFIRATLPFQAWWMGLYIHTLFPVNSRREHTVEVLDLAVHLLFLGVNLMALYANRESLVIGAIASLMLCGLAIFPKALHPTRSDWSMEGLYAGATLIPLARYGGIFSVFAIAILIVFCVYRASCRMVALQAKPE